MEYCHHPVTLSKLVPSSDNMIMANFVRNVNMLETLYTYLFSPPSGPRDFIMYYCMIGFHGSLTYSEKMSEMLAEHFKIITL